MGSVLTGIQRRFLEAFFASDPVSSHFYLSGGTALAGFYLDHRYSEDIDLFTQDTSKIMEVRPIVEASLKSCGLEVTGRRESEEMLEYKLQPDLQSPGALRKIDVVRDTVPIFSRPQMFGVIRVDSLLNIAVNKVAAIFSRSDEVKDYVDLYFILNTQPLNLDALLPLAAQKDLGFDELRFAASLSGLRTLRNLLPFLQRYMVKSLRAEDLIEFCENSAARIFDRHPPRQ